MWNQRHPGTEPPPYRPRSSVDDYELHLPKNGNEKWKELEQEERLWRKTHKKPK